VELLTSPRRNPKSEEENPKQVPLTPLLLAAWVSCGEYEREKSKCRRNPCFKQQGLLAGICFEFSSSDFGFDSEIRTSDFGIPAAQDLGFFTGS
jgi:hypothetical protein